MAKENHTGQRPWVRTQEPLFWLNNAGHERRIDTSYYYDASKRSDRPHFVLQYTKAGTGFYERGGMRHLLPAGYAFIDRIPEKFSYGYEPSGLDIYELFFISIGGAQSEQLAHWTIAELGNVLQLGEDSPAEALLLSLVHRYASGDLRDRYLISAMLYQLFMAIVSAHKTQRVQPNSLVDKAIALIGNCSSDAHFGVQYLAQVLDCSREHLTREFRDSTGVSVGDYIIQHRLDTAAGLLRKENLKLEAVAQRSGFTSANYLCRVFRKRYGVTPARLRQA